MSDFSRRQRRRPHDRRDPLRPAGSAQPLRALLPLGQGVRRRTRRGSRRRAVLYVAAMLHDVSAAVDPESHLLQVATSWDVAGRRPEEFPAATRAEVVARYPRLGFAQEFLGCFQDQATRKSDGAAAASMASDGAPHREQPARRLGQPQAAADSRRSDVLMWK